MRVLYQLVVKGHGLLPVVLRNNIIKDVFILGLGSLLLNFLN